MYFKGLWHLVGCEPNAPLMAGCPAFPVIIHQRHHWKIFSIYTLYNCIMTIRYIIGVNVNSLLIQSVCSSCLIRVKKNRNRSLPGSMFSEIRTGPVQYCAPNIFAVPPLPRAPVLGATFLRPAPSPPLPPCPL